MLDNDENVEDEAVDEEKMEAALELGRLVSEETGVCGEELGKFIWATYQKLTGEIDDSE